MAKRPRTSWYQRIRPALKARIDAAIDTGVQSASEIYAKWNVGRFAAPSTFRRYVARRRRYIGQLGAQVRGRAASAVLYGFGLPLSVARRHGIKTATTCEQCGRPAWYVIVYSIGQCRALCRADFADFVSGLLPTWSERGRSQ